jgi:hypothetical protein
LYGRLNNELGDKQGRRPFALKFSDPEAGCYELMVTLSGPLAKCNKSGTPKWALKLLECVPPAKLKEIAEHAAERSAQEAKDLAQPEDWAREDIKGLFLRNANSGWYGRR